MGEDLVADYLAGLAAAQREGLARVNGPGLAALRGYLASGEAVAFLGAGVSAPLYPLWEGLIGQLVDAASGQLTREQAATCRVLAKESPEEIVEILRQYLGPGVYQEVLRDVLRVRTDPESGRSWTAVQELVCRCAFKAVVTTNYDPGIVDARMRVRPGASATGFTTWEDDLGLDRWQTGDVFDEAELPVLFAHGQHNRPDTVVLATTEYRRAYQGKLPYVLGRLIDSGHLVWIGFSFADQRIAAILREIANRTGTRADPGGAPRHVAVMAWDPAGEGNDPGILARRAQAAYGARVVLYPAPGGDHSALALLLSDQTLKFPSAGNLPARTDPPANAPGLEAVAGGPGVPVMWVPEAEGVEHFIGRAEELARLDRWAADPEVSLVGVTAWGGAGKTALVTHWVLEARGASRRAGVRGAFGWSFYADPSAERWAAALLEWAREELGVQVSGSGRSAPVLALLRAVPLLLVLDGLEVMQESLTGARFGRLLDDTLRVLLVGACQQRHGGLVVLTSRWPFADLEIFDGDSARMLEVPPFTPAEGSELLAAAGGDWLADPSRRALVQAVDGHALATGVLGGLLADRPPPGDLAALHTELASAARTSARVGRVLRYYADRLSEPDRYLLAALSLFSHPVSADDILTIAQHAAFGGRLLGWTPLRVESTVRDRLKGLASVDADGRVFAHPLVRGTFRPLVLNAAEVAADITLTSVPGGQVTNKADALRVVEAIELLLAAGRWMAADSLYRVRTGDGDVWLHLPAIRLGLRAALAFAAPSPGKGGLRLGPGRMGKYVAQVGFYAMLAGDLAKARDYLTASASHRRDSGDTVNLSRSLRNLAECLYYLGDVESARKAAAEALERAVGLGSGLELCACHAYLGWLAGLSGDTLFAEGQFIEADYLQRAHDPDGEHLYSVIGVWWAEFLARTGRTGPARTLTIRNRAICERAGFDKDVAQCDRLLGRLSLAVDGEPGEGELLARAATFFRDGDMMVELADTLPDLAEYERVHGDLPAAQRHVREAHAIAVDGKLVPSISAALAAQARIYAQMAGVPGEAKYLDPGRYAAEAARRLATGGRELAWCELDALHAYVRLDQAEGTDGGWAAQTNKLHARLVPAGLDPDPLATIEQARK